VRLISITVRGRVAVATRARTRLHADPSVMAYRAPRTDLRGSAGLPWDLCTPPASAAGRRHPVGLLCAACVVITPGHGQSSTTGSLSVRAGLKRPG
jgi:hypothetical protein